METRRKLEIKTMDDEKKRKWLQFKQTLHLIDNSEVFSLRKELDATKMTNRSPGFLGFESTPNLPPPKKNSRGRPKGSTMASQRKNLKNLRNMVFQSRLEQNLNSSETKDPLKCDYPRKNGHYTKIQDKVPIEFAQSHLEISKLPKAILEVFVRFLEDNELYLPNKQIKMMFLRICQSLDDAKDIDRSFKNVFKRIKKIKNTQKLNTIKKIKSKFTNFKAIFDKKSKVNDLSDYANFLFGKLIVRKIDDNMVIYKNTLFDLKEGYIVCAYIDGKHSKCPSQWQQSFDIIFEIQNGNKRKSITFATALLKNTKQSTYESLFTFIKNSHCPRIPFIISDYEIAIFNAAKIVWPRSRPRGCFYHYLNNLIKRRQIVDRGRHLKTTQGCYNLASILPFTKFPAHYIYQYFKIFNLKNLHTMRSGDFRLLLYVFETYIVKLKKLFVQDLEELNIRTNNVAEGKNCCMSASFTKKPTMEEYVNHISYKFLNEKLLPWRNTNSITKYDLLLLEIQKCSIIDDVRLIQFCSSLSFGITIEKSPKIYEMFLASDRGVVEQITFEMENHAILKLKKLSKMFRSYKYGIKNDFKLINEIYQEPGRWESLMRLIKDFNSGQSDSGIDKQESKIIDKSNKTDIFSNYENDNESIYDDGQFGKIFQSFEIQKRFKKIFTKTKRFGTKNNVRSKRQRGDPSKVTKNKNN